MDRAAAEAIYDQGREAVVLILLAIDELRAENEMLRAQVTDLEARLSQNSRNSSKPPSSDGYSKPPAKRSLRRPSGRKPGGQPGSPGHHLERAEHPDETLTHVPESCGSCGRDLVDAEIAGEEARQVFDLPPMGLRSCEHRAERRRCACGHLTVAEFPAGVSAPTQYGPRVRALAIYLVNYQHLPYERAAALLADCLGAPVSVGTLVAIATQGAAGLDRFIDEVRCQLQGSQVCHFDETGGRIEGKLRWVHSASTEALTLYSAHDKRGTEAIDEAGVLGSFAGVAVHDGWAPYRRYEDATHALCNGHHLRELQGVTDRDPGGQSWAAQMAALLCEAKDAVDRSKSAGRGSLGNKALADLTARYREIIASGHEQNSEPTERAGKRGPKRRSKHANLLRRLDEQRDDVLRFAHDFRVPFDNNQAERDIRMVKLQQKISGCWRTIEGAEAFLALRSYISTARKQGQDVLWVLGQLAEGDPWLPAAEP